jgi:hypothetical protein
MKYLNYFKKIDQLLSLCNVKWERYKFRRRRVWRRLSTGTLRRVYWLTFADVSEELLYIAALRKTATFMTGNDELEKKRAWRRNVPGATDENHEQFSFTHTHTHTTSAFLCFVHWLKLASVHYLGMLRHLVLVQLPPSWGLCARTVVCKYNAKWNQILLLSVWHLNSNVGYKEPRPLPLWYVEYFHQQRLKFNKM